MPEWQAAAQNFSAFWPDVIDAVVAAVLWGMLGWWLSKTAWVFVENYRRKKSVDAFAATNTITNVARLELMEAPLRKHPQFVITVGLVAAVLAACGVTVAGWGYVIGLTVALIFIVPIFVLPVVMMADRKAATRQKWQTQKTQAQLDDALEAMQKKRLLTNPPADAGKPH